MHAVIPCPTSGARSLERGRARPVAWPMLHVHFGATISLRVRSFWTVSAARFMCTHCCVLLRVRSFWIVRGLLASGLRATAKDIVHNLLSLVDTVGHIPNGARAYYRNRRCVHA